MDSSSANLGSSQHLSNSEVEQKDEVGGHASSAFSEVKEIVARERRHQRMIKTPQFSTDDGFREVIGFERNFIQYLERLEKFAIKIERKKELPITRIVDRKGRSTIVLTRIGITAVDLCKSYDPDVLTFYARHKFSPRLAVMLDAMKKWARETQDMPLRALDDYGVLATPIETMFAEIRRTLKSPKVVSAIKNHRRMERQNFRSCWNYILWLFENRRSRLLFLRVDLYYRALAKDWGASIEAQEIHQKFMRALTEDRIIKDVMGPISKREVGVDRGVHYHMLVAVDGHLHRDAANLTRMLGERWVEICGEDPTGLYPKASYFNCYALKDLYEFNCIGLVRADEKEKMKGLEIAIRYLCKETCHLKPGVIEIMGKDGEVIKKGVIRKRNIRKGIVKKIVGKKRGAPRKHQGALVSDPISSVGGPNPPG